MSFGLGDAGFFDNNLKNYFQCIKKLQETYCPNVKFIPEYSVNRMSESNDVNVSGLEAERLIDTFDEVLSYNFFKSIDLTGDENIGVNNFKEVFRKAKKNGFTLKAHLGEFSDSEDVLRVCETLELDQIQHGISTHKSPKAMQWLRDNDISLNICPTSNLILNRCLSYEDHPIKILHREGVKVTINTDDMLIFNASVSQEYLNLYSHGTLKASELNAIREFGLSCGGA